MTECLSLVWFGGIHSRRIPAESSLLPLQGKSGEISKNIEYYNNHTY